MKTIKTAILVMAMAGILVSCEKDKDFTQVSAFEKALHDEVNKHRKSQGLPELVLQFIMVKEAQGHAVGLANGSVSDPNADMNERWHTVESKLGVNNVSNQAHISATTDVPDAAAIVAQWVADPDIKALLEADLTQSGPGAGQTSDGRWYIMHMFCKWEQQ